MANNTSTVGFLLLNEQAALNGSTVTNNPYVDVFDRQNCLQQSYRNPGGQSANQPPWVVTNNVIELDDLISRFDNDGFTKHGAFHVTTNGTNAVTINLTNLAAAATTQVGDTTFANWNKIIAFNCSGLDGVNGANMTIAQGAANGAVLGLAPSNAALTVPASSPVVLFDKAGVPVNSTNCNITLTPSAGGNFVLLVAGS